MGRNTLDDAEKKRSRKTERALELLARLCEAYPHAFVARGGGRYPVPLSIGVHQEIRARYPDEARHVIAGAMRIYTSGIAYQKALAGGGARVGLDGQPNGEVTAEQAELARQTVAKAVGGRGKSSKSPRREAVTDAKLARLKQHFTR
jgi:ProP effector